MKKEIGRDRQKASFFKEKKLKKVGEKPLANKSKRYLGFDDEDEE